MKLALDVRMEGVRSCHVGESQPLGRMRCFLMSKITIKVLLLMEEYQNAYYFIGLNFIFISN